MKPATEKSAAFTIVELLVIVVVLAIFATLLLPSHAEASKTQSNTIRCLNNHAQLIKAWQMYAEDSDSYVANNYTLPGVLAAYNNWKTNGVADTWAPNVMTYDIGRDFSVTTTDTALAQAGLLALYHQKNIEIYHCPADKFLSPAQKAAGWKSRIRSVSMNSNWGRTDPGESKAGASTSWGYGNRFRQWHRLPEVRTPAERFVFLDEHPDSINDGFFIVSWGIGAGEYPATSTTSALWGDVPGFSHNNGTPFGFADGHTEFRKWFSRPIPVIVNSYYLPGPADIRDQRWYVQHVAERL